MYRYMASCVDTCCVKMPKYQFQQPSSMYNFDLRSQHPIHLNPNIPTVYNNTSWLITHKFVHKFSWIIKHQFEIHPTTTRHKTSKIYKPQTTYHPSCSQLESKNPILTLWIEGWFAQRWRFWPSFKVATSTLLLFFPKPFLFYS